MADEKRPKRLYETGINDKYGLGFLPFMAIAGYGLYVNSQEGREYALKDEQIAREREVVREIKTSIEGVLEERGLEGYTVNISVREGREGNGLLIMAGGATFGLLYGVWFMSKKESRKVWEKIDRMKKPG